MAASLVVNKDTQDNQTPVGLPGSGQIINVGESVLWTYTVTLGPGSVDLKNISLLDNGGAGPDFLPTYVSGDDGDGVLEFGETWHYTATALALAGPQTNLVIGNGISVDDVQPGQGSDVSSYFGADPVIHIVKTTQDLALPTGTAADGHIINSGEAIQWIYTVTNGGNEPLSNVQVSDNVLGDIDANVNTVLTKTGGNQDNLLETGETWTYTLAGTAAVGLHSNTGTATGDFIDDALHTKTAQESDVSSYFGADPVIHIVKTTQDLALPTGTAADGHIINSGEAIQWIYTVTNGGNEPLSNVQVSDNVLGDIDANVNTVLTKTGGNQDNLLETGETWTYTLAGTAAVGLHSNTGTATGDFIDDALHTKTAQESDVSSYFGADPVIHIVKTTQDLALPTGTAADGHIINSGEAIQWIYTVTNGGNEPLSNVQVSDNVLGDIDANVNTVLTKTGGNQDNLLETGETWTYTLAGTAAVGLHSNTGTATGDFIDDALHTKTAQESDVSSYFGADPVIHIVKTTQDLALPTGTAADGHIINSGEAIQWIYTVTNGGNEPLSNVQVSDNVLGDIDANVNTVLTKTGGNQDNLLETGETWTYTLAGTAAVGLHSNTGTATGDFIDDALHTKTAQESDVSSYFGADPVIHIVKTTQDLTNPAGPGDDIQVTTGDSIQWIYTVTNGGNEPLSNVQVSDNVLGDIDANVNTVLTKTGGNQDNLLETGETWTYTLGGIAGSVPYSNTGTATGDFIDDALHTKTAQESDGSSYTVGEPSLTIEKSAQIVCDDNKCGDNNDCKDPKDNNDCNDGHQVRSVVQGGNDCNTCNDNNNGCGDNNGDNNVCCDPCTTIVHAGQEIVYTVVVNNDGGVALDDVIVTDPLLADGGNPTGDLGNPFDHPVDVTVVGSGGTGDNGDGILDVGETWTYTYSYFATQADIDSNATIEPDNILPGQIDNTATATAEEEQLSESASAEVPICFNPDMTIEKAGYIFFDKDQKIDSEADDIVYDIRVTNTGNVTLFPDVVDSLKGPLGNPLVHISGVSVLESGSGTHGDAALDPGEVWDFRYIYDVTQADIDNKGSIDGLADKIIENCATATAIVGGQEEVSTDSLASPDISDGPRVITVSDCEDIKIKYDPNLSICKTENVNSVDHPDQVITYTITVKNTGNVSLDDVNVTDPNADPQSLILKSGDIDHDNVLDVGETWVYTAKHTVTLQEFEAGKSICNIASVTVDEINGHDSAQATATIKHPNHITTIAGDIIGTDNADNPINGTGGADKIYALKGNDVINGNGGNDSIFAGDGTDTLIGGLGDDHLTGGAGVDHFVLQASGGGHDIIEDFKVGSSDRIEVDIASQVTTINFSTAITGINLHPGDEAVAASWNGGTGSNEFLFNSTTHELWYSANGTGSDRVDLAHLSTGVPVATDIHTF